MSCGSRGLSSLEGVDAIDAHHEFAAGDAHGALRFARLHVERRTQEFEFQRRFDEDFEPVLLAIDRRAQLQRHVAAEHRNHRGLDGLRDHRAADLLGLGHREALATVERLPHELERLVQQHAAIARIESGRRRFERVGREPHLAVRAEAALRLQRERAHTAAHGAALVDGHAANVVENFQRRRAHGFRQRNEPRRRFEDPLLRNTRQQRTRRAMRIALEPGPRANQ
jgi:hypothetical protein